MLRSVIIASLLLGQLGCGSQRAASSEIETSSEPDRSKTVPNDNEAACEAITDWRSERIELPPEFAPGLPAGYEQLRFAPGMFKPASETYFTYAFRLVFSKGMILDKGAVEQILDQYYQGLVKAVAQQNKFDVPSALVKATVTGELPSLRATVAMYDSFVTGKPLTLNMAITVHDHCITAIASPQSAEHGVWQTLADAALCVSCR